MLSMSRITGCLVLLFYGTAQPQHRTYFTATGPGPGHGLNFSEDVIHKCSLNQAQAQNFTVEAKLIARIDKKPNPRR